MVRVSSLWFLSVVVAAEFSSPIRLIRCRPCVISMARVMIVGVNVSLTLLFLTSNSSHQIKSIEMIIIIM